MGAVLILAVIVATFYVVVAIMAALDVAREWWDTRLPWMIWRPETGEDIRSHTGQPLRFRTYRAAWQYIDRTRSRDIVPVRGFRVRVRRVTGV